MKILANDGISSTGIMALSEAGLEVQTTKVAQEQLANYINEEGIVGLLVRSATQVRKELIDACPGLKLIGRGGVGMDGLRMSLEGAIVRLRRRGQSIRDAVRGMTDASGVAAFPVDKAGSYLAIASVSLEGLTISISIHT